MRVPVLTNVALGGEIETGIFILGLIWIGLGFSLTLNGSIFFVGFVINNVVTFLALMSVRNRKVRLVQVWLIVSPTILLFTIAVIYIKLGWRNQDSLKYLSLIISGFFVAIFTYTWLVYFSFMKKLKSEKHHMERADLRLVQYQKNFLEK